MYQDGVCRVKPGYYTKTIQFQDINYQLNQNEDKTAIFEGWCDFLNYFDSSVKFQLSFMNMAANKDTYGQSIVIPQQGDDFDNIRVEYTNMLRSQLARGNNGLIKTKYLTFGIEADTIRAAKPRLDRIETDLLNNFKRLGVSAEPLNGKQRLALMHRMFHMDEQMDFHFEWDWLAPSGLSVKDFIAPSSFEFRNGREFGVGKKLGAVSFLQILAPELNDRMLADFLDMEWFKVERSNPSMRENGRPMWTKPTGLSSGIPTSRLSTARLLRKFSRLPSRERVNTTKDSASLLTWNTARTFCRGLYGVQTAIDRWFATRM